jgi:ABC-type polysaccharide/polyol phosphate transport system ATPase subunit
MSEPLIELADVSLCYRLAKQRIPSIKEYAIHWMKGALRYEQLWALRHVSFAIGRGEKVGIIGANGAGKSTLLKVVSRILKPTQGRVTVRGTVSPILELGTGFDYELTGRENIFLNALLLGRSRREIDRLVDDIIDFSGLGEFIDTPIRNYSSGMAARLGFAVATSWRPDILILDEVLAVGDLGFKHHSEARMRELQEGGTTVLLVSHSPAAILRNCERCLWLERGELRADGTPPDVLGAYAVHELAPGAEQVAAAHDLDAVTPEAKQAALAQVRADMERDLAAEAEPDEAVVGSAGDAAP